MTMRLLLVLVLILAGCGSGVATVAPGTPAAVRATPTPTDTPAPTAQGREAVTVKGSGISNSKRFHLSGDYIVKWTATPKSSDGCYHGGDLKPVDGSYIYAPLVNELLDSAKPKSGETNLYGLDDADYYVSVSSGCTWSFTFTPD